MGTKIFSKIVILKQILKNTFILKYQRNNPHNMNMTIFSKIINKEIPADIVYEDNLCLAFKDINPQAPVHILLIPRKPIPQLSQQEERDKELLGHLMAVAPKIAEQQGVGGKYRLVINDGAEVGQTVFHLHLHILGGRKFKWPPG